VKFFFKCGNCGEHEVTKNMFGMVLTPAIEILLQQKEKAGLSNAVAEFGSECPICREKKLTFSDTTIKVRKLVRQGK